jgi:hypothetical protein
LAPGSASSRSCSASAASRPLKMFHHLEAGERRTADANTIPRDSVKHRDDVALNWRTFEPVLGPVANS